MTDDETRQNAARLAFDDVVGKVKKGKDGKSPESKLDGAKLAELLEKNFDRLDPNGNGITREELAQALLMPHKFSEDEYSMLQLVAYYFDTIANMCEDEEGEQTVITRLDKDVLCQFLVHGSLNLDELHNWRLMEQQRLKSSSSAFEVQQED